MMDKAKAAATRSAGRRRHTRMPAAHPVVLRDRRGRVLFRGRASNISENGLLCVTDARRALRVKGKVILDITVPAVSSRRPRPHAVRSVRYLAQVVCVQELGQMVGLGLEFIQKLA